MGIVRFALKFPHTFFVLAALILVLGVSAILSMPTDIFPEINIPVVTVIWQETGLLTPEMEQRVTTYSQYSISTSVNGIRDIEAQTLNGISIQKLYFQPDVDIDLAIAQIVAATNSIRALMPPGIQPPTIVRYDASSVPVLQISLSSDTLNGAQLYDYGIYRMRQQLAPIHGVTLPTPAGGKYRQIMGDIDPLKLQAKGLTPNDVVNAVNAQAFTGPSGTAKLGDGEQRTPRQDHRAPVDHRRSQQHPDQVRQQRDGVHQGCGAGSRRLAGPAKRRSHGRQPIGSAQHHQERQRLDPRGCQRGQGGIEDGPSSSPERHANHGAVRSVSVRQRLDHRVAEGRRDRCRPHGAHDHIIPWLGALDLHRHGLHTPVDPLVARRPLFPWRDDQYDDAWRPGAGDRHPRRRLDGDDRKYASVPD